MPRERRSGREALPPPVNESAVIEDEEIATAPGQQYDVFEDPDIDSNPEDAYKQVPPGQRSQGFRLLYERAKRWGNTDKAAYLYADTHEPRDQNV